MSVEAITKALKLRFDRSSTKFVLVAMANCANNDMTCYPSVAYLADATSQNQKTVAENIRRLKEMGLIIDTGRRVGNTRQVIVYQLAFNDNDPHYAIKTDNGESIKDPRKRNTSEIGRLSGEDSNTPENGSIKDPQNWNTSEIGSLSWKDSNTPENGSVYRFPPVDNLPERPPFSDGKTPVFGWEDPQKRGTEPLGTVINQKQRSIASVDNFPGPEETNDENPAALLSVATEVLVSILATLGVKVSMADPLPWNWAERGVTEQIAQRAVAVARQRKPAGPIPPKYLAPIIEEFLADPPQHQRGPIDWRHSEAGTVAMGQTIGISPLRGELMPEFRSRVQSELQKQKNKTQRRA